MKKRGQFYLAAAMIIIVVIVGFVGVSNFLRKTEPVRIYYLKDELGIESNQVLDHGVYNEFNSTQMNNLLRDFTQNYSGYVESGFSLYFVFGNKEQLTVAGYRDLVTGEISVEHGGEISTLQITQGIYNATTYEPEANATDIEVIVEDKKYQFELKEGENFYFVIYQKLEGGTFIETG
jgi:hypothetical protein